MRSRKPDSSDPRNFSHGSQQFSEALLPCRIAIGIHILAQQLDFAIADIGHLPRFGQHGIRSPAALLAASVRHHAERAELVTSLNNCDVAAVGVRAGGEFSLETLVGLAVVQPGYAPVP